MLAELFSQRAAIESEHCSGMALVVFRVVKHGPEQGFLHLMQHHVIEFATRFAIERVEKVADGLARAVFERRRACLTLFGFCLCGCWLGRIHAASASIELR